MKILSRNLVLLFLAIFSLQSCEDNDDVAISKDLQINSFILRGLNEVYLWQADVPDLADDRFANQGDRDAFLKGYSEPENLFQDLLNKPKSKYPIKEAIDRFSWIVNDYTVLEQELNGITKNSGIDLGLGRQSEGSDNLVGYVRYIIPNSDASKKDIKRGDLFTSVNGIPLTESNYRSLLFNSDSDSYTLNLAEYNGSAFILNGKSVSLTKTVLEENPILINKTITSGNHKIGYLMYNGFYAEYDNELNQAFGKLKAEGITDLVLDLRYNGGGSVRSSIRLASMITGQFPNNIFSKTQYNAKQTAKFSSKQLESLNNKFVSTFDGNPVNSLKLNKIYIIATESTASASELIINGLKSYIEVIQVGATTVGKNVGSITVYDSPSLSKTKVNPIHKYAMQPLVFKITNKDNFGDYTGGLEPTPTYEIQEYVNTYGVLGEASGVLNDGSEPLLNLAVSRIIGSSTAKRIQTKKIQNLPYFTDSKSMRRFGKEMYIENPTTGF
ncbi:S41 family peptidase [Flavobacterium pectinovorum]|uniref:S41 family peptidase n=1 Tax=Flavobacterium pectinovorum TaxID=29533 RepID=UPI001FAD0B3D|nr:S41 family peptidase [Flavobacterium pectinovorum]MCI9844071.1 peptidase S41 [Flavobacterium pectinovorum]